MADNDSYVFRGAKLRCKYITDKNELADCGSHCRRINFERDHNIGMDVLRIEKIEGQDHPFILQTDFIYDEEGKKNISWFGVCKGEVPNSKTITLIKEPQEGESESHDTVKGNKCIPDIDESGWQNVKEDICVTLSDGREVHPITMHSYLICRNGGIIIPVTNGSEYDGELDKDR